MFGEEKNYLFFPSFFIDVNVALVEGKVDATAGDQVDSGDSGDPGESGEVEVDKFDEVEVEGAGTGGERRSKRRIAEYVTKNGKIRAL